MRHVIGVVLCLVALVFPSKTWPGPEKATTHGHCSPNIFEHTGKVTINCTNVDPKQRAKIDKTVKLLNQLLQREGPSEKILTKLDEIIDFVARAKDLRGNEINLIGSPDSVVMVAGRDVIVRLCKDVVSINSLVLEARMTATLKPGAAMPRDEVPFMPLGSSDAYLEKLGGREAMKFVSPIRFSQGAGNRIIVENRFSLDPTTPLQGKPVKALAGYNRLSFPMITIGSGRIFERIEKMEALLRLNGEKIWSYTYRLNVQFQKGVVVTVPLEGLKKIVQP